MKKISRKEVLSRSVDNVLASLRIEKLVPSDYVINGMNACLSGQETTANVMKQVIRHHVTLRRD